jgi:hypothetical protein
MKILSFFLFFGASFALPGSGSGYAICMRIRIRSQQLKFNADPDPDTDPDPKPWLSYLFFVATNFTKLKLFDFEMLKKNFLASFQRIIEHFTPKFVSKLSKSKVWVWDPRSGIWKKHTVFRIPDPGPGVKKAPDPGSGSAT